MGAADDIRAGKLAKFEALQEAGLNNHMVEMMVFVSATGEKSYAGKSGSKTYYRLLLQPNPEVSFQRRLTAGPNGLEDVSHVTVKGAFPEALGGVTVVLTNGTETEGAPVSQAYNGPGAFRDAVESADYFRIDGVKYRYRSGGFLAVDKFESEWTLQLVRADKA